MAMVTISLFRSRSIEYSILARSIVWLRRGNYFDDHYASMARISDDKSKFKLILRNWAMRQIFALNSAVIVQFACVRIVFSFERTHIRTWRLLILFRTLCHSHVCDTARIERIPLRTDLRRNVICGSNSLPKHVNGLNDFISIPQNVCGNIKFALWDANWIFEAISLAKYINHRDKYDYRVSHQCRKFPFRVFTNLAAKERAI